MSRTLSGFFRQAGPGPVVTGEVRSGLAVHCNTDFRDDGNPYCGDANPSYVPGDTETPTESILYDYVLIDVVTVYR